MLNVTDMDEVDCEKRRLDCVDDMIHLERQFLILKEQWVYIYIYIITSLSANLQNCVCFFS